MGLVENQLDRPDHAKTPGEPEPRPKPTAWELVLGTVVAALFAGVVVVAAILSFEWNPAGPVLVVVAAITAGSLAVRRVEAYAFKAAAIGLVVGGIAAILFWPFFDVS
jgi:uncharacterized membrane protein YccC